MKKRYRERALNVLFARLQSDDFDQREHALFQLAIVLRRSNSAGVTNDMPALDSENLPRELRRLRLGDEEQDQVLHQLMRVIARRDESRATALWTLGGVAPDIAWTPTLELLARRGAELNREEAYQVCRALRRWLSSSGQSLALGNASGADFDPIGLIRVWSASDCEDLGGAARNLLREICRPNY